MLSLTCIDCNHQFELDESKVPSPNFNVKCPVCKKVFRVTLADSDPSRNVTEKERLHPSLWEQFRPEVEAFLKIQMDALRKEILLSVPSFTANPSQQHEAGSPASRRALVCEADPSVGQQVALALQRMGYSAQRCSISQALDRLDAGFYDLITLDTTSPDDSRSYQAILNKVNSRKPDERRKVFLAIISDQTKVVGPHAAFFHGANLVVPKSELSIFETRLQEGLNYFAELYRHFIELSEESSERL